MRPMGITNASVSRGCPRFISRTSGAYITSLIINISPHVVFIYAGRCFGSASMIRQNPLVGEVSRQRQAKALIGQRDTTETVVRQLSTPSVMRIAWRGGFRPAHLPSCPANGRNLSGFLLRKVSARAYKFCTPRCQF